MWNIARITKYNTEIQSGQMPLENGAYGLVWFKVATNLEFVKKKTTHTHKKTTTTLQYLWGSIKWSIIEQGMPVFETLSSSRRGIGLYQDRKTSVMEIFRGTGLVAKYGGSL